MSAFLRPAAVIGALLVGTLVVSAGVPSRASELPAWSAGQRATAPLRFESDLADQIRAQAARFEQVLGFQSVPRRTFSAVVDLFRGRTVHEVTYLDSAGEAIALLQLGADGRFLMAARLGYRQALATGGIDENRALGIATRLVRALGLPIPNGLPTMQPTLDGTLWAVSWQRWVDRAPVDGDGLTVRIWRSGALHSVTLNERPLASATKALSARQAREILDRRLAGLVAPQRLAGATISGPTLRWVAANDLFAPGGPDAPARTLRLAWVFEVRFGGASKSMIRALEVWIDAATGDLLGGDVLE